MSRCENCIFGSLGTETHYCKHLLFTGQSRLKDAYKRLGVNRVTEEVRNMLDPINCKFFVRGEPMRDEEANSIWYWRKQEGLPAIVADRIDDERETLYRRGLTDEEIAEKIGTSWRAIAKWRYRRHLPVNSKASIQRMKRSELRKKMQRLYDKGMNDNEIGETLGISPKKVASWRGHNHLLAQHTKERMARDGLL